VGGGGARDELYSKGSDHTVSDVWLASQPHLVEGLAKKATNPTILTLRDVNSELQKPVSSGSETCKALFTA
jgi:hypothetical protein